jgi:hypothetical protein
MKACFVFFFFLSFPVWARYKTELSGNIEAQARHTWNNKVSQEDLFQNWNQENFSLIYGNLNGKIQKDKHTFETNLFARHSVSDLYKKNYFAPRIFTFPQKLVARDIFKLQYRHEGDDYVSEAMLNKFYYQYNFSSARVMIGRMYINYGLGEIFNPVNPFNQPTGLTSISQVAQGNDGLNLTFFKGQKHTWNLYFLGDKAVNQYDGKIDPTIWLHGDYQYSDNLHIDYVGGRDQKRYKAGGQVSYNFPAAMIFSQLLYESEIQNKDPSTNLWDFSFGYDEQLTQLWHVRLESGYQKKNKYANLATFGERFLPTEYFVALANTYEIHPLVKLGGTIINDIKSGFTYFFARSTFDLGHDMEADLFGYVPVAKGDAADNPAQKLVTTDAGVALRAFF